VNHLDLEQFNTSYSFRHIMSYIAFGKKLRIFCQINLNPHFVSELNTNFFAQ